MAQPELESAARARLTQTFKFLKELNEIRNPVQRDLAGVDVMHIDAWPLHPCIHVRRGDRPEGETTTANDSPPEPLIRIRRPALTLCPKPPEILQDWLMPGWQDADIGLRMLEARNVCGEEEQTLTIRFEDDPDRAAALSEWIEVRDHWAEAERPTLAARKLFEKVHALWTLMQREGDRFELVIADGMLGVDEESIKHPVLIQRLNFEFDPAVPEFRFQTGTDRVELHRPLLRLVPSVEAQMIAHLDKELDDQLIEPLGGPSTEGFFRRLVQGLFTHGEFLETIPHQTAGCPSIWRDPVIYLRPRAAGLSTTLDNVIEDLEQSETLPPEGLARIVGVDLNSVSVIPGGGGGERIVVPSGPEPDILFSKPANAEQYAIAARLAKAKAVLVQGPPGTGKTHTIANLLGYLLAQGKTVLVTAHTTKALRVLRNQIDEALQPLCLSVLEGDVDSQTQLTRAAEEIAKRLSYCDAANLRYQAGLLRDKRRLFMERAEAFRRQIRDARFSEIEEVVFVGEGVSPIDAAKRVRETADRDGWIPGPLKAGALCPLSEAEILQLYASQRLLSPDDEAQLAVPQPALDNLVSPSDFRLLAIQQEDSAGRAQAHRPELWNDIANSGTSGQLQDLHQRVQQAAAMLSEETHWLREVLFAGWTGGGHREAWQDLLDAVDELGDEAGSAHRLIMAHGPEFSGDPPIDETVATLTELVKFLEGGGTLGFKTKMTRRNWHRLIRDCRVEDREPQTPNEFRALLAKAQLHRNRNRVAARWRRAVESLGGPTVESLGSALERTARSYGVEIRARLEWRSSVWEPLIDELRAIGFAWDTWLSEYPPEAGDHGELARVQRAGSMGLVTVVEAQAALIRQTELAAALQDQRTYLSGFPRSDAASVFLEAQDTWNTENYEEAYRELARLAGLRDDYIRRVDWLERLEPSAPAWAQAIRQRQAPHHQYHPLGEALSAWRWRQWLQELDRRAAVSLTALQEKLEQTESELRQLAAQIIEHETWAAQRERTGLEAQQALLGFVQTIRRIGRGTGRRAPEFLRQARQLLRSARRSVPVWIMPLNRVYEHFDPRDKRDGKPSVFDVVIIDEASQSDVTALAALYLGSELVVVGDKEQVTPDAVGQKQEDVQRLIASDLNGIPNSHLYDGQTSIYDLAETAFGGVLALREHFRCVPEIIQFSNDLSYNRSIRPLREPLATSVRPAMVAHRVQGFRDGMRRTNRVEAEEIVSLIMACLNDEAYRTNEFGHPTSFGVISLLGDEQALEIEEQLRRRVSPDLFEKHRLLCGNAAQFQGDERDVMFLSMVDGPPDSGRHTLRNFGPRDIYKKRYNVAASRARNQLWVVYSLDPEAHLQPGDLRRRLIEHARDPNALMRLLDQQGQLTDSVFEKLVLERLVAAGFRVRPQWQVGAYRIDLVVEGSKRRLAVECDGERWHTPDQLQHDLERQAILERLGWVFVRIRGSLFFRDSDTAMAPVFARLAHLGIEPLGGGASDTLESNSEILTRIRLAAGTIREDWRAEQKSTFIDDQSDLQVNLIGSVA